MLKRQRGAPELDNTHRIKQHRKASISIALHNRSGRATQATSMAPSPTPDAREPERFSAENTLQTCQQVPQPTDEAISVESSKHDSSEADAEPLALGTLLERFQQYINELSQPDCHRALKSILVDHGVPITQCICLGLGNFDIVADNKDDPQSGWRHRSLHQLAVLTVLLQILAEKHTTIQETYFQDPVFTEVEKAFLRYLGYTVLEDPAACRLMSANTFLFSPFLCHDVAASALMVAFPALYIGNSPDRGLKTLRLFHNHPKPESQERIRIFDRFRNAVVDGEPLPSFDQQSWAKDTTVHWLLPTHARHAEEKEPHPGTEPRIG